MTSVLALSPQVALNPRTRLFATELEREGYKIEALCWDRGWDERTDSQFPTHYVTVPGGRGGFRNMLVLPLVWLFVVARGYQVAPDIVLCPHILLLPAAAVLSWLTGGVLVYDVQELFLTDYANRSDLAGQVLSRLFGGLEAACLRAVDGILTIDTAEDALRKRYARYCENVDTVCNVPEVKPLTERGDDSSIQVVYIGTIVAHRGVVALADAVTRLSTDATVELRYIGPVRDHLLEADIGVAPYQRLPKFEASRANARKLFDYMNAELPIIVPDFGGISALVSDLDCGLTVDTTDPGAIATAIDALATDQKKRNRLGTNGRKAIINRYNWERERTTVLEVICEAARNQ
jgi:glycosyltransferase involved in cell wall biosynthesis